LARTAAGGDTLHMWTQIVGKIRLVQEPMINHWWQVTLYVTSRGFTTSPMPHGERVFQIDFDFIDHQLRIDVDDGRQESFDLRPQSVAEFYAALMGRLHKLGLDVHIWTTPCEIENPIPFETDNKHAAYDADYVNRFWRILVLTEQAFTLFRSPFLGKVSPIHFFWGSFDLAITRFSGRKAPLHPPTPGAPDSVTQEAYSHEVSSAGFWPGGPGCDEAIFYSYAYPQPKGFAQTKVRPSAAHYDANFGEFILPYHAVRKSASPQDTLMQFLHSTYDAAADLAKWDRAALERGNIRG
jgi:hypothetical protein